MIEFTLEEQKLFKVIRDYATSLNPIVIPRLAGGFVRDKILGITSSDIDIALENMAGLPFAYGLSETLKNHPTVHTILANPDKSKHLETAVLTIFGYSIDFVHLRSESYANTRIPTIVPGTPQEDAERRDITINTLFYNLITNEIEDFTGRGLADLENMVIDTPIEPKKTLFDDPLRIIRIFRFKAKFGFQISQRIYDSIEDERIKTALKSKVSNERIMIEIEKMLKYRDGEAGLFEIIKTNYFVPVFKPQLHIDIELQRAINYMELRKKGLLLFEQKLFKVKVIEHTTLQLYLALQYCIGYKAKEKKGYEYVNVQIIRDSLKCGRKMVSTVQLIEKNIESFWLTIHSLQEQSTNNIDQMHSDTSQFDPEIDTFLYKNSANETQQEYAKRSYALPNAIKQSTEFIPTTIQKIVVEQQSNLALSKILKKSKQNTRSFNDTHFNTFTVPLTSEIDNYINALDVVEFVVKAGSLWFECLVILYSTSGNENFINLINKIFYNQLQECYLIPPIVTGDYLVLMGTNPIKFKKILTESLILQIKNPHLTKEEILTSVNTS